MSDTLKSNGRVATDTRPGVWFHNKQTDLSVCVREDRGHGEGGGAYATLLSDTLYYSVTIARWSRRNKQPPFF